MNWGLGFRRIIVFVDLPNLLSSTKSEKRRMKSRIEGFDIQPYTAHETRIAEPGQLPSVLWT